MSFYSISSAFARLVFKLAAQYEIVGLENVPRSGPLMVVANHLNWVDPPLLGAFLPRQIRFMAKEELFKVPVVGWVVAAYQAFPVRRGESDRQALRTALEILRQGGVLGMFPEGTRSKVHQLQAGHSGVAVIALKAGVPILPVGLIGTETILRLDKPFGRGKFKMNIGPTFTLRHGKRLREDRKPGVAETADERLSKDHVAEALEDIMLHIAELLPPEYRGVYRSKVYQT